MLSAVSESSLFLLFKVDINLLISKWVGKSFPQSLTVNLVVSRIWKFYFLFICFNGQITLLPSVIQSAPQSCLLLHIIPSFPPFVLCLLSKYIILIFSCLRLFLTEVLSLRNPLKDTSRNPFYFKACLSYP